MDEARRLIQKACSHFHQNEDIWLEAVRLNKSEDTKYVLAKAIRQMPKSKRLWMKAAEFEAGTVKKRAVILRALEQIPNDETLWKVAI